MNGIAATAWLLFAIAGTGFLTYVASKLGGSKKAGVIFLLTALTVAFSFVQPGNAFTLVSAVIVGALLPKYLATRFGRVFATSREALARALDGARGVLGGFSLGGISEGLRGFWRKPKFWLGLVGLLALYVGVQLLGDVALGLLWLALSVATGWLTFSLHQGAPESDEYFADDTAAFASGDRHSEEGDYLSPPSVHADEVEL
jgi:hypothetical protein